MFVSLPMKTQCPRCRSSLEVQHADGSASDCPVCGHSFVPAAPERGAAAKAWLVVRSAYWPEPPMHICVTCHSIGSGERASGSDWGSVMLFVIGVAVMLLFHVLIGVAMVAVALINSAIASRNKPKLLCTQCESSEMIPLSSPRAAALLSVPKTS